MICVTHPIGTWHAWQAVGFLGLCALVCVCAPCGCTGRPARQIQVKPAFRILRSIRISGRLHAPRALEGQRVEVRAVGVPPMHSGKGTASAFVTLASEDATAATLSVPYDLREEPMEAIEETTTTDSAQGRPPLVSRRAVRRKVEHYLVSIIPPPGWTARPAQLQVEESTTDADFTLTPAP